MILCY